MSTYEAVVLDPLQTKLVLVLWTTETREVEEVRAEGIVRIDHTRYAENDHQSKGHKEEEQLDIRRLDQVFVAFLKELLQLCR